MSLKTGIRLLNPLAKYDHSLWIRQLSVSHTRSNEDLKSKLVGPKDTDTALLTPEEAAHQRGLKGLIAIETPVEVYSVSGVPDEHVHTRTVLIKKPTKNSMQSGSHNIQKWQMTFEARERWENPLMGWSSTADPLSNTDVAFATKEEAIAFCDKNGWAWKVQEPPQKTPRAKSYAASFSWNSRTRRSTK